MGILKDLDNGALEIAEFASLCNYGCVVDGVPTPVHGRALARRIEESLKVKGDSRAVDYHPDSRIVEVGGVN